MTTNGARPDSITVAHTSDLHIGGRWHKGDDLHTLRAVLEAVAEAQADILILAGDIFDTNRVPPELVDRFGHMLSDARVRSVFLPGNHDPATPESAYRLSAIADIPAVSVIGIDVLDTVRYPDLDLDIWGAPHLDYTDMVPLASPPARSARWHIAVAHGHYVRGPHDHHRSWLIRDEEIAATNADYVALGHWDLPQPAGQGPVPAYYSGSPDLARTLNIIRLTQTTPAKVRRHPLHLDQ